MMLYRWFLICTLLLIALASTGVILAQSRGGLSPPGVNALDGPDPNYDDGWTMDIPDTIGGLPVVFVTTPKNQACSFNIPIVHLRTPHDSIEQLWNKVDAASILNKIRAIKSVPADVTVSFVSPSVSTEVIQSNTEEWNATKVAQGCDEPWTDIENGNFGQPRGWAVFQNKDAGLYTNDNGQSVYIRTPSTVGSSQNSFSAALNSTKTNGASPNFFIQTGMNLKVGNTFIGWTDVPHGLSPQPYQGVPFYYGEPYFFSNTYTSGVWQLCAGNFTVSPTHYQCVSSSSTTGTTIVDSINTVVEFENANTNTNWYSGFPSTMSAYGAQIYRNGIGQNWSTEDRLTLHDCWYLGVQYLVSGAMGSTTLKSGGTGTWTLSGVPRVC